MFFGAVVNALAVAGGSIIGMLIQKGFPEGLRRIIFQGLGLCTLALGITMVIKVDNILIVIFSVLLGGITGEVLKIQDFFDKIGDILKKKLKSSNDRFTEGFVSAFLIFCIGPMTIMGAFDAGVRGDHTLYLTKSLLDFFASIALAVTYGSGVLFSSLLLLAFQSSLVLLAQSAQGIFTTPMIHAITSTGGVLVLSIGFNLLDIQKIKTSNLLPSLVFAAVLTLIVPKF